MDTETKLHPALYGAVARLLRPLFRLLLRHGVAFRTFEEIAKRAYIDVSLRDFAIPGKKPSVSRAAILSGLTRKEVLRLRSEPVDTQAADGEQYNRAARVLTAWARHPDFVDASGQPRRLDTSEGARGFAELVRRHGGDVPVRAVLDELIRVGAVQRGDDLRLQLVARAYVPQRGAVEKLGILGTDVADLIATIAHNIEHGATDPRFQRKVMYHHVPVAALPAFRDLSATHAQRLLERLDHCLAEQDTAPRGDPAQIAKSAQARVGMGIFYFEERLNSDAAQEH